MYFDNCHTAQELKDERKRLVKLYRKDFIGVSADANKERAQQINIEYEQRIQELLNQSQQKETDCDNTEVVELLGLLLAFFKKTAPKKYAILARMSTHPIFQIMINSNALPKEITDLIKNLVR